MLVLLNVRISIGNLGFRKGVGKMLVLSRRRDESFIIGDNIVITVVDIRGDKVRLGINAPGDVPVYRQEVYEAIQREEARSKGLEYVPDPKLFPKTSK